MPKIRAITNAHLKKPGLPKEKVLATVVQLLEKTLIRVGNDEYAKDNHSYGLSTLKDSHVRFGKGRVTFKFKGKSNVHHDINEYLQEITHRPFTAKDFRTWGGAVFAAIALRGLDGHASMAEAKRNLNSAIDTGSKKLGNTKSICRKCYIHPELIDSFMKGEVVRSIERRKASSGVFAQKGEEILNIILG